MRAWVERNPDDADAEIWREVIALRTYERIAIGDPELGDDPAPLDDDCYEPCRARCG